MTAEGAVLQPKQVFLHFRSQELSSHTNIQRKIYPHNISPAYEHIAMEQWRCNFHELLAFKLDFMGSRLQYTSYMTCSKRW